MFNIEKNVLGKNLYYKNHLILKYSIEYPKIVGNSYSYAIQKFNHFYQMKAIELKLYAEKDLFDNAKQVFDYNEKNNFQQYVQSSPACNSYLKLQDKYHPLQIHSIGLQVFQK